MRRILIGFVIVAGLLAATGALYYRNFVLHLQAPIGVLTAPVTYEVTRGAALTTVLTDLQKRGWLEHARETSLWMKYFRPGFELKAGEYELAAGSTALEVIETLGSGKVLLHKLTIVEGSTLKDLRASLSAQAVVRNTAQGMTDAALLKALGEARDQGEGLFFPDTYRFPKDTSDVELLRVARERMHTELEQAWAAREPGLPLANAYEALILASIVEKETALASERPMIAGVFIERLRRGMRLQTDPTVIYGMGDAYDGNIRKSDLLRDTPYNTYTRAGLPPTPICLPGAAALDAAVHPKQTGALFFVATGKGDGSHYFSRTLEEHNAALQRYLKTLRQR